MKKYSLKASSKFSMYLFLAFIPIASVLFGNYLINHFSTISKNDIIAICIFALVVIFWLYLCRTQFVIFKEKNKAIAINHEQREIILFDRKNQVNIIPFDEIEHISISKGEILKDIVLGQVSLLTKTDIIYRITISNIDNFNSEAAKDFDIDVDESIFFHAKSNNQVENDEKNNNPVIKHIKTLIFVVLAIAGLCAEIYQHLDTANNVNETIHKVSKISSFDYKNFADNLASQAVQLIPSDISKEDGAYLVEKLRKNTYLAGESLSKDPDNKFSNEQMIFISQVIAEWTFHKTVDLARSGVPSQYWDDIIQKISFNVYEVAKQGVIKNIEQKQLLQDIEQHVRQTYNASIEELKQKGVISEEIKKRAESQSNIDLMAKEELNKH